MHTDRSPIDKIIIPLVLMQCMRASVVLQSDIANATRVGDSISIDVEALNNARNMLRARIESSGFDALRTHQMNNLQSAIDAASAASTLIRDTINIRESLAQCLALVLIDTGEDY